jgi:lysophospholipase L1-like esterase
MTRPILNRSSARGWAVRLLLLVTPFALIELLARTASIGSISDRAAIRQLKFGTGMEAGGLVEGWDVLEPHWVWANRPTAKFVFQDVGKDDLYVTAQILAMKSPDGESQALTVVINDTIVAKLPLRSDEYRPYSLRLPASALRRGDNSLCFDFRYVAAPAAVGLGPDQRTLAAAFRELDFSRPVLPLPSRLTANETYQALPGWQMVGAAPDLFAPDSKLLWRLRPGPVHPFGGPINSHGWRGPPVGDRQSGRIRIVCLGDSRTFGTFIKYRDLWTVRLAKELIRRIGRPVEVINAGTPGYSSYQGWMLLQEIVSDLQPDAVTWYFGMNDLALTTSKPDHLQTVPPRWIRQTTRLLRKSRAYQLLEQLIHPSRPVVQLQEPIPRVPLHRFRANLEACLKLCQDRQIPVVLLFSSIDPAATAMLGGSVPLVRAQQRLVHELATHYKVSLLDLDQLVAKRGEPEFFRTRANDPTHPSTHGHAVVAEELAPLLAPLLRGDPASARISMAQDLP